MLEDKEVDVQKLLSDIDNESINNGTEYIKENILNISKSDLSKCIYDKKMFQNGINKVSELCGSITALVNVGITPSKAIDYLAEQESTKLMLDNSIELSRIQAEAAIKSSKNEVATFQKNIF